NSSNKIDVEGVSIDIVAGYPAATTDGIIKAAGLEDDFAIDANGIITQKKLPNDLKSSCGFKYTAAVAADSSVEPSVSAKAPVFAAVATAGELPLTAEQCGGA